MQSIGHTTLIAFSATAPINFGRTRLGKLCLLVYHEARNRIAFASYFHDLLPRS